MFESAFYTHGLLCASHPWEVIVGSVTVIICMLTMGGILVDPEDSLSWRAGFMLKEEMKGLDAVVMTVARCLALLYIYHQFRRLWKLGSMFVLGVSGLFAVFSWMIFSSSMVNILRLDFTHLSEAWPFFLLLIDLSKASCLAKFAIGSTDGAKVRENIAHGFAALGPGMTLDTLVATLVIGVGTLSGVKRLEIVCYFACTSVISNYIAFMSIFPGCLSLVLEMTHEHGKGRLACQDEDLKPNPVLQRVKVIMSAGLMLVHVHSRWPILLESESSIGGSLKNAPLVSIPTSVPEVTPWAFWFEKWVNSSPDRVAMFILAVALCIKYAFFEQDIVPELSLTNGLASETYPVSRENSSTLCVSRNVHIGKSQSHVKDASDSKAVQTDPLPDIQYSVSNTEFTTAMSIVSIPRTTEECLDILKVKNSPQLLTDEEILALVDKRHIPSYQLEWALQNPSRGVAIRRHLVAAKSMSNDALEKLPFENYDYTYVMGACCENVIGYVPVPVGVAGPLLLDGKMYYVPLATTEGCLVASTNRGCRALLSSGGVHSSVVEDGMTRGPVVRFATAQRASEVANWLQQPANFDVLKASFDSSSRFARLRKLLSRVAARYLFIRFQAQTGDAMGMNMLSKGTEVALRKLQEIFPDMEIMSLSGNFCCDKKPAAVNWIEGRGKSVVCEATVSEKIVREVLKTSAQDLVEKNTSKNLVGSAIAGSIGGFNAQAANIVTAIFIATGQDPAQNVTSSNCLTLMELAGSEKKDLYISVTMPSIEIGTVGGGTVLPPQSACLEILGVKGPCNASPGRNASTLARIVCATVLAGELSLMSALASGDLVKSHLKHNRSEKNVNDATERQVSSEEIGCKH